MGLDYKKDLTKEQYDAVTHTEGPAMVVAGPGGGKTRCLTYRIAYLIEYCDVDPHNILAITFTNKAANEMKERVSHMVPRSQARQVWISTFHSMCARMLRTNSHDFEVHPNYSIADSDDSKAYLLEAAMKVTKLPKKEIKSDREYYGPGVLQRKVSDFKNTLVRASDLEPEGFPEGYERDVVLIYQMYERLLNRANSLDFDDLLLYVAFGLQKSQKLREGYGEAFEHILVDEYHDTNLAQFQIMRRLAKVHRGTYVIGDTDQSIYGFRGADPEILNKFFEEYPERKLYTLEKNFRSVQPIADVANEVIAHNPERVEKKIVTVRPGGEKVRCLEFAQPHQEAGYIVDEIEDKVRMGEMSYKDFTVLYRINARSRPFEDFLRRKNIPYKVVGALGFYQRKVVKDLLAYLKLLHNINDYASFNRIYNVPSRGIGESSYHTLLDIAEERGCSPMYVIKRGWYKNHITGVALQGVRKLKALYRNLRKMPSKPVEPLLHLIGEDSGYRQHLHILLDKKKKASQKEAERALGQLELLEEFEHASSNYDQMDNGTLGRYLEFISLLQSNDKDEDGDRVYLMSVHASKGLEFPHVYLVGCCEGILPHSLSMETEKEIEEERRIFFVGCTRAENALTLSHFQFIPKRGDFSPSRFLDEAGDTVDHQELSHVAAGRFPGASSFRAPFNF